VTELAMTKKPKWLRFAASVIMILLITMAGGAAYVFRPIARPPAPAFQALDGDAAQGEYLATIGNCAACHTRPGGKRYAGGMKFRTDFGTLFSTNITADKAHGLGAWTFSQFYAAMKHGVRADGNHLYPAFPYNNFAQMTDKDIASLFLYFRTVAPVSQANRVNDMRFPFGNRQLLYFWKRMFHEAEARPEKFRSVEASRGAYLVNAVAHCGACHTPRNMLGGSKKGSALQGGVYIDQVANGSYRQWSAVDLTRGAHGLDGWSKQDIISYLLAGQNPHAVVNGPMKEVYASTKFLTPKDAAAIASYLHIAPKGPKRYDFSWARSRIGAGEIVYTVHCGTCHLPSGKGDRILGVPLANNAVVEAADPSSLINVILYGPDLPAPPFTANRTKMKAFGKRLSDEDIAALATYLRSRFGNNAPQVTPEQVAAQR
jgi:mono/diheme cytochrome c family protein